jgi:PAS domain S-box-containing protein
MSETASILRPQDLGIDLLFERIREGVIVADVESGRIVLWNPGAAKIFGYAADEAVGLPLEALVPARLHARHQAAFAQYRAIGHGAFIDSGEPLELPALHSTGEEITVELSLSSLGDAVAGGRFVLAVIRDVSARKRGEEARAQLAAIVEASEDAIIGKTLDGTITSWNPAAARLYGYSAAEAVGQSVSLLYPPDRRDELPELLARVAQGESIAQFETERLRKDGTRVAVSVSIAPVRAVSGTVVGAAVVARDVTERKRAEAVLEESNRELARANRVKSDFLAMMSHEIRTPMNGVIGMAGLLLDTDLTAEQREYAESVRTSGEALLTIINDILDFSKIEAGRLDLEKGIVDVQRTVEDVLDLLAPQARARGLELAALVAQDVPPALGGDPGRLRQILVNLVGNAVKFTPAGEVVVRASVDETMDGAVVVRFTVVDTGVGIVPDVRAQLFEPFTQAEGATTRRYGGTGLGLAISRRLVELMGGQIGVESPPGQGSTFWFTVRLQVSPWVSVAAPIREVALEGRRVLVVDDNATNRTILEHHITRGGMHSAAAADGPTALGMLRQTSQQGAPYDIVVLDLEMPGMDGLDVARAIRADPALASTRLVLLASATPRERGELARRVAIDAFLTKPVRPVQLYTCLATVLAGPGEGAVAARPSTSPPDPPPRPAGQGRVLVVEDNAVSQRVAVRMLETRGYRADAVANGREALEALARVPYDLVLMDCQMSEMDGYAATAEIRRREQARGARRMPIIAMTANAMAGDDQACLAAGMDAYIPKPITRAHLDAVLAQWQRGATPEAPGVAFPAASGRAEASSHATREQRDDQ